MSSQILFRSSGIALMLGSLFGLIWIIMSIILPITDPNQFGSLLFLLVSLLMLLGSMLIVSGLVGMYARQAIPAGWLGLIGFISLFFGLLVFGVGFGLISTTIIPWLTTQAPNLIAGQLPPVLYVFLAIAIVMIAVGNIPLGVAIMRAGILPRWPGLLLIASGVTGLLDIAPFSSIIKNIIAGISAVSFFAGLAWAGYALWSEREVEEVQAPVAPVAPVASVAPVDTSEAVIEPE